ncbi:MAG: IS1 family transposase [Bryobacteraceae bacterium]|jgi:IS1 family transposase
MNRLNSETRVRVIRCLVDGNSIRTTARITGTAKNTITKFLVEAGSVCSEYQDRVFRNLCCRRVRCDAVWSFVGAKDKNVSAPKRDQFGIGSVWTWTAIDDDSKLVPCWMVGTRDVGCATEFIQYLAGRLAHRVQLTTGGHMPYLTAVEDAFGGDIDYAMLVKLYGADQGEEKRYSTTGWIGCRETAIMGDPDPQHISTPCVEHQDLTIRMSMRRFTCLTNALSKKLENHIAALGLNLMYYNFVRIQQRLRVSPAMAAGVTSKLWSVYDIVALIERHEAEARGVEESN